MCIHAWRSIGRVSRSACLWHACTARKGKKLTVCCQTCSNRTATQHMPASSSLCGTGQQSMECCSLLQLPLLRPPRQPLLQLPLLRLPIQCFNT